MFYILLLFFIHNVYYAYIIYYTILYIICIIQLASLAENIRRNDEFCGYTAIRVHDFGILTYYSQFIIHNLLL